MPQNIKLAFSLEQQDQPTFDDLDVLVIRISDGDRQGPNIRAAGFFHHLAPRRAPGPQHFAPPGGAVS